MTAHDDVMPDDLTDAEAFDLDATQPRCTCKHNTSDPERGCECGFADWAGDHPAEYAHAQAVRRHPDCESCILGYGTLIVGTGHSDVHAGHCTCDRCW